MNFKKISIACMTVLALPMSAHALQINDFATLTKKQIESSYFFDWNRNSTFRGALFKSFKSSGMAMPTWLRKGGGTSAPAKVIDSGATHFVANRMIATPIRFMSCLTPLPRPPQPWLSWTKKSHGLANPMPQLNKF